MSRNNKGSRPAIASVPAGIVNAKPHGENSNTESKVFDSLDGSLQKAHSNDSQLHISGNSGAKPPVMHCKRCFSFKESCN